MKRPQRRQIKDIGSSSKRIDFPYACLVQCLKLDENTTRRSQGSNTMSIEKFEVWCNAERRVIGDLELPKGETATVEAILQGYTPITAEYMFKTQPGEPDHLHDGTQVLCPQCKNPLLIKEPGGDRGVYLMPGAFEVSR